MIWLNLVSWINHANRCLDLNVARTSAVMHHALHEVQEKYIFQFHCTIRQDDSYLHNILLRHLDSINSPFPVVLFMLRGRAVGSRRTTCWVRCNRHDIVHLGDRNIPQRVDHPVFLSRDLYSSPVPCHEGLLFGTIHVCVRIEGWFLPDTCNYTHIARKQKFEHIMDTW